MQIGQIKKTGNHLDNLIQINEMSIPHNTESSGSFTLEFEISDPQNDWWNDISINYTVLGSSYQASLISTDDDLWEVVAKLQEHYGVRTLLLDEIHYLPNATGTIGFITPVTEHFCYYCNRLRLTADGKLRLCLLSEEEIDLREPLRSGASSAELKSLIEEAIARKPLGHNLAEGSAHRGRPFSQVGG